MVHLRPEGEGRADRHCLYGTGHRAADLYQRQCRLPPQLELRLCPLQANPKLVGKVGVTNIPALCRPFHGSCAGGWQYVVNNYSKNRDLAIKLAV